MIATRAAPVTPATAPVQTLPKVRFRGVSKRFGDGADAIEALSPIDLDIDPNAFLCLVGPSGCGKSTLLKILAGFETRAAASSSSRARCSPG